MDIKDSVKLWEKTLAIFGTNSLNLSPASVFLYTIYNIAVKVSMELRLEVLVLPLKLHSSIFVFRIVLNNYFYC